MELTILDHDFNDAYIIDSYESLIWTERYREPGDFELYTPVNSLMLGAAKLVQNSLDKKKDIIAWNKDSDTSMFISSLEIKTDLDSGNRIIFSGKSLSSILDRRIVWEQTTLDGYLEGQIEKLLNQNIINPTITDRKIKNFVYVKSGDPRIEKLKIRAQYTGDNLLEVIEKICETNKLGFNVWIKDDIYLAFQLYMGQDRSYDQKENQEIIFSPNFENLLNTNYLESINDYKNVALIAGEDEAQNRRTRVMGSGSDRVRRELFVDARDLQSTKEDGTAMPDDQYYANMDNRGKENLDEHKYVKAFDGSVETNQSFQYGRDFFKGDIVQIENEYGMEGKVRIVEVVRSQDSSGIKMYPTFEVVEEE